MFTKPLAAVALLLVASHAHAAGDIAIDAKVTGNVVVLAAKTDGKVVVWIIPESLTQPVPADAFRDSKTCVCQGKPGTYRVTAISAVGDKPIFGDALFTLVGDGPPAPPPGPPIPPPPVDDLPLRLKALYAAETSPAKRGQLVNLVGIYQAMAEHAANDKSIVTSQELLDVLTKVKTGMLMDGVLLDLRRAITVEVAAVVGPPGPGAFDRDRVAAMFKRIVKSLPTPE